MSNHIYLHVRRARSLLVACAVGGALVGLLVASTHAGATAVNYCANWYETYTDCEGPIHNLDANIAWDDTGSGSYVCSTATTSSGSDIGGWGCGWGEAETCYAGDVGLHGWILNDSGYWLYMNGTEYYSQGCP